MHQHPKIRPLSDLVELCGTRPRARKVIMAAGVWDIVHPGHVRHLMYAKSKADILIVSVTCDRHVNKGVHRPHVPQDLRAMHLAALEMVDYVMIDPEATPLPTILALQPEFFCKGNDYSDMPQGTRQELSAVEAYGGELLITPGDVVYSSSRIIDEHRPAIGYEKLLSAMERDGVGFDDLRARVANWAGRKVLIVGDTIVDSRTHCELIGGGSKTPTLSVRYDRRDDFIGGAAIVAKHLAAAGAEVTFSTVLGNDALAEWVLSNMSGITVRPTADATRPTTQKNTFVCRDHALLKVDVVQNHAISQRALNEVIRLVEQTNADTVIFSDFRHGMFSQASIPALCAAVPARCYKVADSQVASRWGNILEFQGFDLITPNEREARFAIGEQDSGVRGLVTRVYEAAKCGACLMKLAEHGVIACRSGGEQLDCYIVLDSFARTVIDPVGAGDALLAYAALAQQPLAGAILGSIAAALECEREGNIPVAAVEVLSRLMDIEREAGFGSRD